MSLIEKLNLIYNTDNIENSLTTILNVVPGEHEVIEYLGFSTREALFKFYGDPSFQTLVKESAIEAIRLIEDRVDVISVVVQEIKDERTVVIDINYIDENNLDQTHTVTISFE